MGKEKGSNWKAKGSEQRRKGTNQWDDGNTINRDGCKMTYSDRQRINNTVFIY